MRLFYVEMFIVILINTCYHTSFSHQSLFSFHLQRLFRRAVNSTPSSLSNGLLSTKSNNTEKEVIVLDGAEGGSASQSEGIWNDSYVTKVRLDNGKVGWKCGWCNNVFKTLHATRVLCHILKIRKQHIAICKAIIPAEDLARYQAMRDKSVRAADGRIAAQAEVDDFIDQRQESATELVL